MSKVFIIANPQQPSTLAAEVSVEENTDWDKCVLCQTVNSEVLQSPASSRRSTDGAGYKTLADKLLAFNEINCLPSSIVSRLMESQDLEEFLKSHQAKWHESCRLQYNKTKLERAAKRQASAAESSDSLIHKKYTRHSSVNSTDEKEQCFFCGEPAKDTESFHHASTFGLDRPCQRMCSLLLQDQKLLAKLSTGDLIALEAKYHIQCLVSLYNRARQSK